MAIREIREIGEPILAKKAKPVKEITPKITELIDDMLDTMYEAMGVGLAAPQVGVLKQVIVIDVGEGPIVLINPEIINEEGEQIGQEGCLSVPGKIGIVKRPNKVRVRAYDENWEIRELEGEGLLARAFCHETDHLKGEMFVDKTEDGVYNMNELESADLMDEIEEEE
ncbi:MAG TPA: peptide deformylase [Candidatus Dorea intestinavium]|nr:peptide deformylase [Candidatus Dorea intestinavium]